LFTSRLVRKIACSSRFPLPGVISISDRNGGHILTFDDGPDPIVTPLLLDLLQEYKVQAVFFILGINVPGNEHIIKRIVDEGHLLGNHSYHHKCLTGIGSGEFIHDVIDFHETIDSFVLGSYRIFRPPQGLISFKQLLYLKRNNIDLMFWNFDSRDSWLQTPEEIAHWVDGNVSNRDKVLLFHDDNIKVVKALKILFTSQFGFLKRVVPASELLNEKCEV